MTTEVMSNYMSNLVHCPEIIKNAPFKIKDSKDAARIVLSQDGSLLSFFSDNIKDDNECVLIALSNNVLSIRDASDRFKNNRELLMTLAGVNSLVLEFTYDHLRDDEVFASFVAENHKEYFFGFAPEIKTKEFLKKYDLLELYNR